MKVIPVIGDYGQFSRALKNVGVETILVPFVDFMGPGASLSLSLLNEQINATYERLEGHDKCSHLPGRSHHGPQ